MKDAVKETGFSLLELSVVLIILALLAGGIMAGQDMIRQSRIKSVLSDTKKYEGAYNTFILKYDAMPGDMPNATQYWGAAPACPDASGGTGTQTCNGTGNNWIANVPGEPLEAWREQFFAWQHLSNAKLVEGRFTGIEAASPRLAMPGQNVPAADIQGTGFSYLSAMSDGLGTWWPGANYAVLSFGVPGLSGNVETGGVVLTTTEMQGMDDKIDDGLPAQGLFRSRRGIAQCMTNNVPETSRYNLLAEGPQCSFTYSLEQDPGLTP